jgi:hypothetical protein
MLQLARRVPDELGRMSQFLASVFRPGWHDLDRDGLSTTLRLTAEAKYFALYRFVWWMKLDCTAQPNFPDLVKRHPTFPYLAYNSSLSLATGLPFVAPVPDPTGVWLDCDLRCGEQYIDRILMPANIVLAPENLPARWDVRREIFLGAVLPQIADRILACTKQERDSILEGCRKVVTYGATCTIARTRNECLTDIFSGRRGAPGNMPHNDRRQLLKSVCERLLLDSKWSTQVERHRLLSLRLAEVLEIE